MAECVEKALDQYALYHRDKRNECVHLAGIPLIVIGLGIFITNLFTLLPMLVIYIAYAGFCRKLKITLPLAALTFLGIAFGLFFPWWVGLGLMVLNLAIQIASHRFFEKGEGRNPAFFTNLKLVLVAPIWWARQISNWKSDPRI